MKKIKFDYRKDMYFEPMGIYYVFILVVFTVLLIAHLKGII